MKEKLKHFPSSLDADQELSDGEEISIALGTMRSGSHCPPFICGSLDLSGPPSPQSVVTAKDWAR